MVGAGQKPDPHRASERLLTLPNMAGEAVTNQNRVEGLDDRTHLDGDIVVLNGYAYVETVKNVSDEHVYQRQHVALW